MRNKLRQVRISKKFTQQQIADKVNITRAYYTKIELGNRCPSLMIAIKIKEILKYKKDDLFEGDVI